MAITTGKPRGTVAKARSDRAIFERQEFGGRMGFGRAPALLVVDFTVGFNDPDVFGGGSISRAIRNTMVLLEKARSAKLPVIHTRIVYADDGSDADVNWCRKIPRLRLLTERSPLGQIVPELAPRREEIIIRKRLPSAFFGTDLAGVLIAKGVDTVLIAGCTTSGCVRASAVDAMCYGFRTVVVGDCVGDRAKGPHESSLFDIAQKYADVINRDEALRQISRLKTVR